MTEDLTPAPEDPYGIAKLAVERDLWAAREMFGLNSIVFRPHPTRHVDNVRAASVSLVFITALLGMVAA